MARTASTNQEPAPEATPEPTPEVVATDAPEVPKPPRFRADNFTEAALKLITEAGEAGIEMRELGEKLGVPYRTISNITWHLEGQPEPRASDGEQHGKLRKPENRVVHRMPGSRIRYQAGPGEDVPAPTRKAKERLAKAARAATTEAPAEVKAS